MSERPILLVTGASRGIGAATAILAAERGYDVAINYQANEAAARAVADTCRAAGARAEIVQGDMAVEADIHRVFETVDGRLGRLTHLVNNAGIVGRGGRVDDADPAMIRAVIDLNVTGAILVARQAVRRMSPRHGGRGGAIVNISSAAATLGAPGEYVWYAASKGAIDSLTYGLSRELAREDIRVNAVAPGLIATEIHAAGGEPGRVERLAPQLPTGRAGTVDEVAETVLFLLSEAASYVSGTIVRVSGAR
jgi:NAD(P)-dependent dehydrogenase (short-subunit alcohol dehydrogenase family)